MNVPQRHEVEGWTIQEGRGAAFHSPCIAKRSHSPGSRIPQLPGPTRWPRSLPPWARKPCGTACSFPLCTGHDGDTPFPSWSPIPARSTGRKRALGRFALSQTSRVTPSKSFYFINYVSILIRVDTLSKILPAFERHLSKERAGKKKAKKDNVSIINHGKAIDRRKHRPEQSKG
jgi:hypothetical protein